MTTTAGRQRDRGGWSQLAWDEAIGLDLRCVEHWSSSPDLTIRCRTSAAGTRWRGAY